MRIVDRAFAMGYGWNITCPESPQGGDIRTALVGLRIIVSMDNQLACLPFSAPPRNCRLTPDTPLRLKATRGRPDTSLLLPGFPICQTACILLDE